MADNKHNDNDSKNNTEGVDDSEEENEILEESPCGRWLKRREQVEQRDIPGIDATYLAMDTEEGVEVVWNEVRFSERKYFKTKEETISEVFDRLIQLEHPNIVKLHKYWVHKDIEKPRVIFITEYMSSGSLKTFLRKTKKNLIRMALNAWKRWCTQTLSALCYLHSSQPPIVHGNLNCDTIFISYNGLIKIGAVAPDAIHKHVKTVRGDSKANVHFIAPEIGCISDIDGTALLPSVDIYSFGMCALEMAALEISPNGESSHITDDVINNTIESLENPLQKDLISRCLNRNPNERPTARELLFHPIIFEVPSLRLFSAHVLVKKSCQPEQLTEEAIYRKLSLQNSNDRVLAEIRHNDSRPNVTLKKSDSPKVEFEKFFEEVRNGAFPLTAIVTTTRPPLICRQRTMSPELSGESTKQLNSPDNPYDEETRRILTVTSSLEPPLETNSSDKRLVISLHIVFDDKINRKLSTKLELSELIPSSLAQELVFYGFINKDDHNVIFDLLSEIESLFISSGNQSVSCQKSQQLSPQQPIQQTNTTQVLSQQSKPVVIQPQSPAPTQPIQTTQPTKQQSLPIPITQPIQPIAQPIQQPIQQPIAHSIQQQVVAQPIQQPVQQAVQQPLQQAVPQQSPQLKQQSIPQSVSQTIPPVILQPAVGPQSTPQQTIRTQIPAQTQTPTQMIPQIRGPQQVSQQSTQSQTQEMSPSVTSQTVGATPQPEKKTVEQTTSQRPVS